jgi:sugar (pentulose or hexulose) kinase
MHGIWLPAAAAPAATDRLGGTRPPRTLAQGVSEAITEALSTANCAPADILACGIACQRNTDFVWDADTNQPVANAISWQDLRTGPMLAELDQWSQAGERRQRLGYFPGTYSSALHLSWRLRHDPAVIAAAQSGWLTAWFLRKLVANCSGEPKRLQNGLLPGATDGTVRLSGRAILVGVAGHPEYSR